MCIMKYLASKVNLESSVGNLNKDDQSGLYCDPTTLTHKTWFNLLKSVLLCHVHIQFTKIFPNRVNNKSI